MNDNKQLLIFDVDGTLTYSAGLTRVAFETAAREIYGIDNSAEGIKPFGSTDQQIFKEILENNNLSNDNFDEQFNEFARLSNVVLEKELNQSQKVSLLPGIADLLEEIPRRDELYLALGTGNIEINALAKLKRHNVDHYFPVGGYGTDSIDRDKVIKFAYQRSCDYYSHNFEIGNTWVIGDTPKDIASGKALGAKTIAVATGEYSPKELRKYNPTELFEDFQDQKKFFETISD